MTIINRVTRAANAVGLAVLLTASGLSSASASEASEGSDTTHLGITESVSTFEPAINTTCTYGRVRTQVATDLSNGRLDAVFCGSSSQLQMARTQYTKRAGSATNLKNTWEWTNTTGGTTLRRQFSVTYKAEVNKPPTVTTWNYPNGQSAPDSSNRCVRGGVQQQSDGQFFTTRVGCPSGW